MRDAQREKSMRRVQNAKAKREMLFGNKELVRHNEVKTKINRIRDLSSIKEAQKKQRVENAIRHQELLKSFLDGEKNAFIDERPLQYTEDRDTSAFLK